MRGGRGWFEPFRCHGCGVDLAFEVGGGEVFLHYRWSVDLGVGVAGITAGVAMDYVGAAGVGGRKVGHVPDLVVDDDPAV